MHNKNNPTLIKTNFIKTANFLEDLIGSFFNNLKSIFLYLYTLETIGPASSSVNTGVVFQFRNSAHSAAC